MNLSVLDEALALLKANDQLSGGSPEAPLGIPTGATTRVTGRPEALLRWCRATENAVVERRMSDARVIVGFQAYSRSRPVAARYARIGGIAASLHVVGAPDRTLEFPVTAAIPVERGPLLDEWFLLVAAGSYHGLLVAREIDGQSARPHASREYTGLTTHDAATVAGLAERLSEAFDAVLR